MEIISQKYSTRILKKLREFGIILPDWLWESEIIHHCQGRYNISDISTAIKYFRKQLCYDAFGCRKICRIYIEMVQNILIHAGEKKENNLDSIVFISQNANNYFLTTINPVEDNHILKLNSRLSKLRSMNKTEITEQKFKILATKKKRTKGAGIGLLQIALLASFPIDHLSYEINNQQYILISVTINKQKNHEKN